MTEGRGRGTHKDPMLLTPSGVAQLCPAAAAAGVALLDSANQRKVESGEGHAGSPEFRKCLRSLTDLVEELRQDRLTLKLS